MAEAKTKPTQNSVEEFLDAVPNSERREDARWLLPVLSQITGEAAVMWGTSIVGFGAVPYGAAGDLWPIAAFSPRAQQLVVYVMAGFVEREDLPGYHPEPLLESLGRHSTGKSCLYIKRLQQVDREVLVQLLTESVRALRARQSERASASTA